MALSSLSFEQKAAIEIAKGLVSTGVEGPYDTVVSSTAGDYPSIGCSCWEGKRADALLSAVGLSEYIGRSFSSLSSADISKMKAALGSSKGQEAQYSILSKDTSAYVSEILGTVKITDIRCLIYAGIWCPTSSYCVCRHLSKFPDAVNNLEALNSAFIDGNTCYALTTANVGEKYAEGYKNRGNITYNYCKKLKDEDMGKCDPETLKKMESAFQAFGNLIVNSASAANMAVSASVTPHGKHKDTIYKSPSKLYCEPVYPDLVRVKGKASNDTVEKAVKKSDATELKDGGNMIYIIPEDTLLSKSDANYQALNIYEREIEKQKNQSFDYDRLKYMFKVPSEGKPLNDRDEFPVDSKIKELEEHNPRCKISSIKTCPEAANVAKECVKLSMNVERRLVRLENNMATLMRYLWRLAARMPVNCMYYGGQGVRDKYKCIRCLKDNRVEDGQLVTFDQCMTCTRYEPIIGQIYEILNDQGLNLAEVMDECQLGYMTPEEYADFARIDKKQKKLAKAGTLGFSNRSVRDKTYCDIDFSEKWTPEMGVKMNWGLIPVEEQIPHINGETLALSSNPTTRTNSGYPMTTNKANSSSILKQKKLMDAMGETAFGYSLVQEAKEWVEAHGSAFVDDMNATLSNNIIEFLEQNNCKELDSLLVAAFMCATGKNINIVVSDIQNAKKALKNYDITSDFLIALFNNIETQCLTGSDGKGLDNAFPKRLDKVTKIIETENSGGGE